MSVNRLTVPTTLKKLEIVGTAVFKVSDRSHNVVKNSKLKIGNR